MNNEERKLEIEKLNSDINKTAYDREFLALKIKSKTFSDSNDEIATHKSFDELDNQLNDLYNKRRNLQTEYSVDFFNDQNILVTGLIVLNRKIEINTRENGWDTYLQKIEIKDLLCDILEHLLKSNKKPGINNIISN